MLHVIVAAETVSRAQRTVNRIAVSRAGGLSGAKSGDPGKMAGDELGPAAHRALAEDSREVRFDGSDRHEEPSRYLPIGSASDKASGHDDLSLG